MFKKLLNKKLLKNQKGLTLIELLAVIVILAIIAAIAIPAIGNIINNSKDKAILSDAAGILAGAKIAIADGACGDTSQATVTCNEKVLKDVFDGKISNDDKVEYTKDKNGKKTYTIHYKKLGDIKNIEKFTVEGFTPGPGVQEITDEALNRAMNK
ncbi:prepilin-type N-terminal cleavage/methylation domain-containing protein [Lysinibacillus xylanilyticus]|uniref:prepilin-type N-terminal cleavage/methylation domain-containing protein n=1 Tax=Lysinibacillus xylanilyticus TaxID=582475 RepID=UPI002B24F680|nr:prepilin-type N-terminal cleavage/methylation domain-containing protein [Lysinibacillus xylanilyticus]MEB2278404.1 prepilin-type N-terminal cleavage/methylation domain-containing protein [Lysinibacillus xylanilyticus]